MLKQFLFGFPVIKQSINKNLYDKEKIVSDILYNYNIDANRNNWDSEEVKYGRPTSNLHHSYCDSNNNDFIEIDYSKLIPVYDEMVSNAINQIFFKKRVKFNYTIKNYSCIKESHYMRDHVHLGCDFAGVHYLKFNKDEHFATTFINTNKHSRYADKLLPALSGELDSSSIENSWIYEYFSIDTDEDDFIITPGLNEHAVPYHKNCKDHRITIAININIESIK